MKPDEKNYENLKNTFKTLLEKIFIKAHYLIPVSKEMKTVALSGFDEIYQYKFYISAV